MNIVCFHNPDEDNGYLSNWYPSSFTVDGVAFSSMEQFMMYRKAICFGDEAVAAQILSTSDVAKIKSLGRQVSNYDESMWNGIRQIVVYEGLLAKFSQNEELKAKLKVTGNAVLAECAVKDRIWGIGLSMKDPDRLNKAKWNGQNLLGYALMMVRERLQQDYSWEQRKLTEFVEFFSGLTYTPNDVQENGTLVLRSSNVSNGEVVDADNVYVNPQVVNSENVKVGDIVVVVRNGSRSLIGKHAQIKAFMPNTVIGAFMTGIRSECPEFTNALLNTSRFEEEIAMNMGATINQITGYMFSKMEFKVPCLDEQKKIGEYFEKLDNLITLHQRELYKYLRYRILKVRRKS